MARAGSAGGAGFLLAVLWFDLMFDVQVLRYRRPVEVPDGVIASIAAYYRRVTTDARPMNRLVAVVMVALLAALVAEVVGDDVATWRAVASLVLAVVPIGVAAGRTVKQAVRLGSRADPFDDQVRLARSIGHDHLFCVACIAAVLVIQLSGS